MIAFAMIDLLKNIEFISIFTQLCFNRYIVYALCRFTKSKPRNILLAWVKLFHAESILPAHQTTTIKKSLFEGRSGSAQLTILLMWIFFAVLFTTPASVVAFAGANYICNHIQGLAPQQRIMCQAQPNAIIVVNEGAHMGMQECQKQFKHHRWNCRPDDESSIFEQDQKLGTKEAAYESAIRSAGVLHAIVTACGEGGLSECGCAQHGRSKWQRKAALRGISTNTLPVQSWEWGGCSVDLNRGLRYSKEFWDAREIKRNPRGLMNIHNYEAGRKAVVRNVKLECKCHGVSGSCTARTCWVTLPQFRKVGNVLMEGYLRARKVSAARTRSRNHYLVMIKKGKRMTPPKRELIYLDNSPTYCDYDNTTGSYGTTGRICNRTSLATDSCRYLCCDRGYKTRQKIRKWDCKCKFYWCCHVKCKECHERTEEYTCI